MQVVGFHKYTASSGEIIRFAVEASSSDVMSVTGVVNGGVPMLLPIAFHVDRGAHYDVVLDAAFSTNAGGRADIRISGSSGGDDVQHMRQIPGNGSQQSFAIDQA